MKRRGSYLGGSTVVAPGSNWYSKEADPTSEEHRPTFQEILKDFISEEIISNLAVETGVNEGGHSRPTKKRSFDTADEDSSLIGCDSNRCDPKPYVPAHEGRKFAKSRPNSPFKRPKRQPVIEYKPKKD